MTNLGHAQIEEAANVIWLRDSAKCFDGQPQLKDFKPIAREFHRAGFEDGVQWALKMMKERLKP